MMIARPPDEGELAHHEQQSDETVREGAMLDRHRNTTGETRSPKRCIEESFSRVFEMTPHQNLTGAVAMARMRTCDASNTLS